MSQPLLPPGPRRALLEELRYQRRPYQYLTRAVRRYGDPFTFPALRGPRVTTGDPEGVRAILSADPDGYEPLGARVLEPLIGAGSILMLSRGEHHRTRKLLVPPFHGPRLHAYGAQIHDIAVERTQAWAPGAAFPLLATTQAITLDVILRVVFGVDDAGEMRALHQAILEAVSAFAPSIALFAPLRRRFGGVGPWALFEERARTLEERLRGHIARRRADADARDDVLSLLLAARYDDGSPMSEREIIDQLMTLMFAGHETTAIALAWAVYLLLRHPAALERAAAEVAAAGSVAALDQAPFLEAVCHETLRLYPVVPIVSRKLRVPLELCGWQLPAGVGVGIAVYLVHQRPELYPEPGVFRPERFLERTFTPFEYLPFGGGHRRCLGSAFAIYEMKLVLATLLGRFRLALADSAELYAVARAGSVGPNRGVPVRLRERLRAA